jgi:hypothetical protein
MPLPVVAIFLPFAALIALVVVWPRWHASRSSARLIAEAIAAVLLVMAIVYGTVMMLQRIALRW